MVWSMVDARKLPKPPRLSRRIERILDQLFDYGAEVSWFTRVEEVKDLVKTGEEWIAECDKLKGEYLYKSYAVCEHGNIDPKEKYVPLVEISFEAGYEFDYKAVSKVARLMSRLLSLLGKAGKPYYFYINENPDFVVYVGTILRPYRGE
jgi:hypothetical protein